MKKTKIIKLLESCGFVYEISKDSFTKFTESNFIELKICFDKTIYKKDILDIINNITMINYFKGCSISITERVK